MDFKLIGSTLLIVGISIGAGMLALPIATAELGFLGSLILLFACWFVMTASALLILEVNLWLPQNSNLISMARATIGPIGQIVAWISYLLLLYSLLCAYIGGGSDLLHNLVIAKGLNVPSAVSAFVFTAIFGVVVIFGIRAVDYVNRGLMLIKLGAFFLLVILLSFFISIPQLKTGDLSFLTSSTAIMVTITSFGYATIVPSLRVYFAGDVNKLRKAILLGSLIPLICYIAWDAVIMGIIPLHGDNGLISILHADNSTSSLVNTLDKIVATNSTTFFTKLFTSICVVTSFLGVALSLVDFLSDGLQIDKKGMGSVFLHGITFLPPLIIVLFIPNAFIAALKYAGIYCVVLLIILPAWMAWAGRYHKKIAHGFAVPGGKVLLGILIIFSCIMVVRGFS